MKYWARKFKLSTQVIKDENELIGTNAKGIAEVWGKYCSKLLPPAEVKLAVSRLGNGKSTENDAK